MPVTFALSRGGDASARGWNCAEGGNRDSAAIAGCLEFGRSLRWRPARCNELSPHAGDGMPGGGGAFGMHGECKRVVRGWSGWKQCAVQLGGEGGLSGGAGLCTGDPHRQLSCFVNTADVFVWE